jgi:hypothetical protein
MKGIRSSCQPLAHIDVLFVRVDALARQLNEAKLSIEPLRPLVVAAQAEMNGRGAKSREFVEQGLDHAGSVTLSLGARQEVDVEVRRKGGGRPWDGEPWLVELVVHALGGRPGVGSALWRRVERLEDGKPFSGQRFIKRLGMEGAKDVPAYALVVLEHEGQVGLEGGVGAHVAMPEDHSIGVEEGSVLAGVSGAEADLVDSQEVLDLVWSDGGRGSVHATLPDSGSGSAPSACVSKITQWLDSRASALWAPCLHSLMHTWPWASDGMRGALG